MCVFPIELSLPIYYAELLLSILFVVESASFPNTFCAFMITFSLPQIADEFLISAFETSYGGRWLLDISFSDFLAGFFPCTAFVLMIPLSFPCISDEFLINVFETSCGGCQVLYLLF